MNNRKLRYWLILLPIGVLGFWVSISRTQTKKWSIGRPSDKVWEEIGKLGGLTSWFNPFTKKDSVRFIQADSLLLESIDWRASINLKGLRFNGVVYSFRYQGDEIEFLLTPTPNVTNDNQTQLTLTYSQSYFNDWFGNNSALNRLIENLEYLKKYLEDPIVRYGFDVQIENVQDSMFLVHSGRSSAEKLPKTVDSSFNALVQFAEKRGLGYNQVRIFYKKDAPGGLIDFFAGIGVQRKMVTQPSDLIQFMMMPPGRLLVAYYKGPFGKLGITLANLDEYARENEYKTMALPFEKWISSGYFFADSQEVEVKLNYPIY